MDARFAKNRADRPTLRQWLRFRWGLKGARARQRDATRRDAGVAVTHYQRKREERAEERVGVMRYVSPANCGWMGERR